jgi:uncharacterized protein (DUF4415 family)
MTQKMPKTDDPDFNHGFPRDVWEDVSDNPELTEEDFKLARPFREVFPELAAEIERSRGRPVSDNPKKQVTQGNRLKVNSMPERRL